MSLGGAKGASCPLTCDIPDPTAPGWKLATDIDGCMRWFEPIGDSNGCPATIPDAGFDVMPDVVVYDPCEPADATNWIPDTMQPPISMTACTAAQLDQFWDACLDASATQASCSTFESANKPCTDCLVTDVGASKWGPLVCDSINCVTNPGGCVALAQGQACGQAVFATFGCEGYSCSDCAASNEYTPLRYEQCTQEADGSGCHKYLDAQCPSADASVDFCFAFDTKASSIQFESVFCKP
jgi:hypothetical protein